MLTHTLPEGLQVSQLGRYLCVTSAQRPSSACLKITPYCWENDFGGERGPLAFQSR